MKSDKPYKSVTPAGIANSQINLAKEISITD